MIIQNISKNMDVIIPNIEADINKMSPVELVDLIETENSLYYLNRMIKKRRRVREQNRRKPGYILKKLLTAAI